MCSFQVLTAVHLWCMIIVRFLTMYQHLLLECSILTPTVLTSTKIILISLQCISLYFEQVLVVSFFQIYMYHSYYADVNNFNKLEIAGSGKKSITNKYLICLSQLGLTYKSNTSVSNRLFLPSTDL